MMDNMDKEAINALGVGAIGAAGVGGTILGLDLIKRLRSKSEAVRLNRDIIDAQREADEMIADDLGKEAGMFSSVDDAVPYVKKLLQGLEGIDPRISVPVAALGAAGAAGATGYGVHNMLDKDRSKMKKVKQYARRRALDSGAPTFRNKEDLLGKVIELRQREHVPALEEAVAPAAIEAPPAPAQLPAPAPIDTTAPAVREEPVPVSDDPYASILAGVDKEAGMWSNYLNILKGGKTKPIAEKVKKFKDRSQGLDRKGFEAEKKVSDDFLKRERAKLLKARLQRAAAWSPIAAVPVIGSGVGYGIAKHKNKQEQKVANQKRQILKIASDKLKDYVSGDTVLKQEKGNTEIQDVAEIARKKKDTKNAE